MSEGCDAQSLIGHPKGRSEEEEGDYPPPYHDNYPQQPQLNQAYGDNGVYYTDSSQTQPVVQQPPPDVHSMDFDQQYPPSNYCALAVFVMLCCCTPIGCVATSYSCRSTGAAERGNYEDARELGMDSRRASIIGIVIGIPIIIVSALNNFGIIDLW